MSDRSEYSRNDDPLADPLVVDPTLAPPVIAEPVIAEPVIAQPVVAQPVVAEPVAARPVVAEPVLAEPRVVAAPMAAAPAAYEEVVQVQPTPVVAPAAAVPVVPAAAAEVRRSFVQSFAPDAIVAAVVGLFVLLVGLLAITRGGFDGPIDEPVVSVVGFTHTTLLGLIEIILGACLLLSGATRSRSAALFFGSVLGIAAFVGAVQTDSFDQNLALESGFAWLLVIGAVAVVLSALLLPRYMRRSTVVQSI
jgi:hypothetical protein